MLVRTQARALELAMRSALGAAPARLIRQILVESVLLAICGGLLGLVLAAAKCRAMEFRVISREEFAAG